MTDKEIIIDGVDVSKCDNFSHTEEHYCNECSSEFGCAICDERPNCCYKQLKRKEQECEKYKQTLTEIKGIAEKQCNICEALTSIDEYKDCKKCWQGVILQKISEVNNGR